MFQKLRRYKIIMLDLIYEDCNITGGCYTFTDCLAEFVCIMKTHCHQDIASI